MKYNIKKYLENRAFNRRYSIIFNKCAFNFKFNEFPNFYNSSKKA